MLVVHRLTQQASIVTADLADASQMV
jgi:hypothetical protein